MSCWDDSNDTQIVDHHDYGTAFKSEWLPALYRDPAKGSMVTEGGSRWFQPEPIGAVNEGQSDQGSPLTVLNFLQSLRVEKKVGNVPFVPGVMMCWELMVGNSNTRWHWGTAEGSPEPAVPWDAWIFPDGTPVSHTETGAFRRYITGVDEFLAYDDFLPKAVVDGDVFADVPPGTVYCYGGRVSPGCSHPAENAAVLPKSVAIDDGLFEASLWADETGNGVISLVVRAAGPFTQAPPPPPAPVHPPTPCHSTVNYTDTDIPGADGYRDLDLTNTENPHAVCASACCNWPQCNSWIVRPLLNGEHDNNCTYARGTRTCCWLKREDGSKR